MDKCVGFVEPTTENKCEKIKTKYVQKSKCEKLKTSMWGCKTNHKKNKCEKLNRQVCGVCRTNHGKVNA